MEENLVEIQEDYREEMLPESLGMWGTRWTRRMGRTLQTVINAGAKRRGMNWHDQAAHAAVYGGSRGWEVRPWSLREL